MIVASGFWRVLCRHPASWAVLIIDIAALVGFLRWFEPPLTISALALVVTLALLALWPPLFSRSPAWAAAQQHASDHLDRIAVARMQTLEADLRALGATQAVGQLRGLREKLAALTAVVERRLNAGELTFGRYRGTAEQVYLSAIDNLHEVAVALTSIRSIDAHALSAREAALAGRGTGSAQQRELESVRQRLQLFERQTVRVSELLADNEAAMTALSNTAGALAEVRTQRGHASIDVNTAMAELEALAARAAALGVDSPGRR
ncbi:MAG: hypothetical protein GKR94_13465 [Gammaproteobacteria bacterium]|nr:hypothetical protein [Gammaproteobacteria bacterium]